MIGSLNPNQREVTIVGAGISGLLAAWELDRRGFEVTLIEAEPHAGGLIRTIQTEYGPVERAAHSLLATPEVRKAFDDLGVELVDVRPDSRARYILRDGKMRRFPLTPWEAFKTFNRAYFVLAKEGVSSGNATLEQWARRHLGEAALEYLLSPFLTGVYAAKPSEIAVGAAFPSLEIPHGQSLLSNQLRKFRMKLMAPKVEKALVSATQSGPRKAMMVPANGMGSLIDALDRRLTERLGSRYRKGQRVENLPEAPNLVLAVQAGSAAKLLERQDPALARALSEVRYSPLVTATIFVPRDLFSKPPRGVGVLIPESEKRHCLGVLFNSSAFPGRVKDESQWVSLTMMLGGSVRPEMAACSESELQKTIRDELSTVLGIEGEDPRISLFITCWPQAIPQYSGQLTEAWDLARRGWCSKAGRILFGNYTGQVSLRGMIQSAQVGLRTDSRA